DRVETGLGDRAGARSSGRIGAGPDVDQGVAGRGRVVRAAVDGDVRIRGRAYPENVVAALADQGHVAAVGRPCFRDRVIAAAHADDVRDARRVRHGETVHPRAAADGEAVDGRGVVGDGDRSQT